MYIDLIVPLVNSPVNKDIKAAHDISDTIESLLLKEQGVIEAHVHVELN